MLALFLNIFDLLTADSLLKFAGSCASTWQILISLCLDEDSLEGFNSFSHACMQRRLDRMEMIVEVLAEANKESEWLVQAFLQVAWEESERNHTVRVFYLC